MNQSDYLAHYDGYCALIEQSLNEVLPVPDTDWPENQMPRRIVEPMRYSILGGGKRLRGVLLLAANAMLGGKQSEAAPFAAAVEMIHAYSLVHDDLPAMDDDDVRRGKPSNHKAFGEAAAILAGDGLLNLAFEVMASSAHPRALEVIRVIARSAGASGMIAGQCADLAMEGESPDAEHLLYIHRHKTADLITAPVVAGLLLAGADENAVLSGEAYGQHLGLAFQIVDDLLDIEGDPAILGKSIRKDLQDKKMTWPSVHGMEASRQAAQHHVECALDSLASFGAGGDFLRELAQAMLLRVK